MRNDALNYKVNRRWLRKLYSLLVAVLSIWVPAEGMTQQVKIIWNPVTMDINGLPETQPLWYHIYCDTIPAFTPGRLNFLAATLDTEYVHTDARLADPNRHLFYIIRAVDLWGNQSADSDTVGETSFVLARAKMFLQAPYDAIGDTMQTDLRDRGMIALKSPYLSAPRTLQQMPEDVVDWILLQVRDPQSGTVLAEESFLLKKDGSITELDGVNQQLGITGVGPGEYQLVVRHRNHVAVMARPLMSLKKTTADLYDFSVDSTAYFGKDAAKELEPGVWGMWSGDINQDGLVSEVDYEIWKSAAQEGKEGYQVEDLNFDGLVTTRDYVLWYRAYLAGVVRKLP